MKNNTTHRMVQRTLRHVRIPDIPSSTAVTSCNMDFFITLARPVCHRASNYIVQRHSKGLRMSSYSSLDNRSRQHDLL